VHFCRFIYKLLQRIESQMEGRISKCLKQSMWGLIFYIFNEVADLRLLKFRADEFRASAEYRQVIHVVSQYEQSYCKELNGVCPEWPGFVEFDRELTAEIKKLFENTKNSKLELVTQKVIILDYLVSLKQLSKLLGKNGVTAFHEKSKIEVIVEGRPAKVITEEHLKVIVGKLKATKLI
jgi:hypothetical protein